MQPGKFTELFFLDEATAFAAGHRPCALCRREDYVRFGELWRALHPGQSGADAIDEQLHRERVGDDREQRLHEIASEDLPEGAFVLHECEPWLVLRSAIRRWTPEGYAERSPRPRGRVQAFTPPSLIEILRTGWRGVVPLLHPSARKIEAADLARRPTVLRPLRRRAL